MADDPYRKPAEVEPDPTSHERMLARVRGHRRPQPERPDPTDAPRYDRESLRIDSTALAAGFAVAILFAAALILLLVHASRAA